MIEIKSALSLATIDNTFIFISCYQRMHSIGSDRNGVQPFLQFETGLPVLVANNQNWIQEIATNMKRYFFVTKCSYHYLGTLVK